MKSMPLTYIPDGYVSNRVFFYIEEDSTIPDGFIRISIDTQGVYLDGNNTCYECIVIAGPELAVF